MDGSEPAHHGFSFRFTHKHDSHRRRTDLLCVREEVVCSFLFYESVTCSGLLHSLATLGEGAAIASIPSEEMQTMVQEVKALDEDALKVPL